MQLAQLALRRRAHAKPLRIVPEGCVVNFDGLSAALAAAAPL